MELRRGDVFIAVVIVCFSHFAGRTDAVSGAITGRRAPCVNEGEAVDVDYIDKSKCYSCICQNGFVECRGYRTCNVEGCHMLTDRPKNGCCKAICKGCFHKGFYHESHTEWSDPGNPCRVMRCEAGVVTESDMRCHTPCSDPLPPAKGQCCPTCPECKINGQNVTDDRDVTSDDDPCLKCRCIGGRMTCSKKACPVLQCPETHRKHVRTECCPQCTGTRSVIMPPKVCRLGSALLAEGQMQNPDKCTTCTCLNETTVCLRNSCPILDCSPDLQKKDRGSCCAKCIEPEEVRTQCSYGGNVYEDGQSWELDACSSCKCIRGMPSCARTRCNVTLPCPPGTKLSKAPGDCCQKCQEIEGVCMAFGDPHYKTFDGKIYSFQGVGKYQLVADCYSKTFSVRVANVFQHKKLRSSTLTKRVQIKVSGVRINLGQEFKTKVDGQIVSVPHKIEGKVSIENSRDNLIIRLHNGVKVLWSGKSFVEVTVPATFKNKLCGLCGNFNLNVQDDLRMRKGPVVKDSKVLGFGNSWCVGTQEKCLKQAKQTARIQPCKIHNRVTKYKPCKYLTNTELFNECDSRLNYHNYYKACLMDMCNCPDDKCYCESLTAYAHECQRLGVNTTNWQTNSDCTSTPSTQNQKPQKSRGLSIEDFPGYFKKTKNSSRVRKPPPPLIADD